MKRIVIFTKNVLAEKKLRDQLEILNYEVFVTNIVLKNEDPTMILDVFKFFNIVIFSETLPNDEFINLSKYFVNEGAVCVRRTDEEDVRGYSIEGLHYLLVNSSLSELREKLSNLYKELDNSPQTIPKKSEQSFHNFHNSLSRLETTIIIELSEDIGNTVSREKLCKKIWHENVNNSRLVQVSTAVRNIRKKALESGMNDLSIITYWGKGYELNVEDEVSLFNLKSKLKSS